MDGHLLASQALNGLGNGLIYFLIAVGLTLVFGLMNFVNFAHGSFFLLGAYVANDITSRGGSFWLALLLAPLIVAALAAVLERGLLRYLYTTAHTYQIVATFALAIFIQEAVTLRWGTDEFTMNSPTGLEGAVSILGIPYPSYRILVVGISVVLAIALWLMLERTRFGSILRAGSEDSNMVSSLGINVYGVFALTFSLAAALAAMAGVLSAPMRGITPGVGNEILGLAFVIVVVGQLGSYLGALIAAIAVALVQSLVVIYAPASGNVVIYVLMAAVLLARSDAIQGRFARA